MKITKQDIGGELLSIITKGMYADPKDALREYIQNGVDALAEEITVKIRHDHIVVMDNGSGMNNVVMRKAIRVGISDKNPKKSVGFMGIGVYSSFHLCDELTIYSRVKDSPPHKLSFDFKSMKEDLDEQKLLKLKSTSAKKEFTQIDLLTLLERNIDFKEIPHKNFPQEGTRVEMRGLEANFFRSLSKDDEVSEYLERVLPLPFSKEFSHGEKIYEKIQEVCAKHKTTFRTISVVLDINGNEKNLYRPYKDSDFKYGDQVKSLPPKFYEMNSSDGFLGIAWGCLNSNRKTISNDKVRGFVVKKQGFTIGKREDVLTYFGRATYFNRYVGEFIAVHPQLYPNGPRTDFEYSNVRTTFYSKVTEVAEKFNNNADDYQESEKAKANLADAIDQYNEINTQVEFFKDNGDKLLEFFRVVTNIKNKLQDRKDDDKFEDDEELMDKVNQTLKGYNDLLKLIKKYIDERQRKKTTKKSPAKKQRIKPIKVGTQIPKAENLPDLISLIGIEITDDIKSILELIDEKFIKTSASNKTDYQQKLLELREEIEELFE